MTMNLSTIVSGILFGFFVALVCTVGFSQMSADYGVPQTIDNSSFVFTNSLEAANQIQNTTQARGVSTINTFFPALGTLFDVWNIILASVQDMTQTIENTVYNLGGNALLVTLKTIIIASILLAITFIILAALFRQGSWKIN